MLLELVRPKPGAKPRRTDSLRQMNRTPRRQPGTPPRVFASLAGTLATAAENARKSQDWTAYKNNAREGISLGAIPVAPVPAVAPALVPPYIFGRVSALAARIKKHPGYTEAIGQDLGIIGAEQTVDPSTLKPILELTLAVGHPNVGWTKQGMDGLEIWVDRGNGTFSFLAIDTVPDYLDTAPLPAPGTSAVWKYKAVYRFKDEQVGQWSKIASLSAMR